MLKLYILAALFFVSHSLHAYASTLKADGIHIYLQQGKPELAISSAQKLLRTINITETERFSLLSLIMDARIMITRAKHYENVTPAVEALETLIKEFPDKVHEPSLIWKATELFWNQNNLEATQSNILDLQNRFPDSLQAKESWLMLGKIHFIQKKYSAARNAFLRFATSFPSNSPQGLEVRMWTALIDYEEKRLSIALRELSNIFQKKPELITTQDSIYSRYIHLLSLQGRHKKALQEANTFLSQYKAGDHSSEIRLLQADLKLKLSNPDFKAILKTYTILAENQANTIIGRQAFMRKLMLQTQESDTYFDLKPAIIALKRIANQNQMSTIEDEALLHEATLWQTISYSDLEHAPPHVREIALKQFRRAAKSTDPAIQQQAIQLGKKAFYQYIQQYVSNEQWLPAVSLWEGFTAFQPPLNASRELRFEVAKGLRLLMAYDKAASLLSELHQQDDHSVWGEKIMLEKAHLWYDNEDENGLTKIMQWLDDHEYTLYRSEMLLIVAKIQFRNKRHLIASHTLDLIHAEDISPDIQAEYWQTTAQVAEAMKRWHIAAHAWALYTQHSSQHIKQALLYQAHALFKGKAFEKAEALYKKIPENMRNHTWEYRYSICQLKSGKWNQAISRLNALKSNPQGGIYTSMAALTLAEREADKLLEIQP